nr:hypothetical protein [Tanacetum cinerariifolium]
MAMVSSRTRNAVERHLIKGSCSTKDKKRKGLIVSSTLCDIIDLYPDDDVSDSHNVENYIILSDDEDEDVTEDYYEFLQSRYDNIDLPTGIEASIPLVPDITAHEKITPTEDGTDHGKVVPMEDVTIEPISGEVGNNSDVLRKYRNFKKFDIVDDYSDHHYSATNSAITQPPRHWAKKIQEEWRILKNGLPDMIFVRAYESRMDLLRVVIIGAEGTPYHDGLFFFDVCFPNNYPHGPPKVHYHSGGLSMNPNLYRCGKVCLSLLNTWSGAKSEQWVPGASTMLQVLVSIQGMILNAKPYFNEPGYAASSGSDDGEKRSLQYSERTLVYSLKTMVYTMRKPPKHFQDLVIGYFRDHARGILTTCKAYTKGVKVGCAIDSGEEAGSRWFKSNVEGYMKTLIGAFKEIGAENVDEFIPPTPKSLAQKIWGLVPQLKEIKKIFS